MPSNDQPQAANDYGGLDNNQLRFIFHRFSDYKKSLDENLSKNRLPAVVSIPGVGEVMTTGGICAEHAQEARETPFYHMLTSVLNTLDPVIHVIETADDAAQGQDPFTAPKPCA
jgi:hypothetical protein